MVLVYHNIIILSTLCLALASVLFRETSHTREFPENQENLEILSPPIQSFWLFKFRVSGQFKLRTILEYSDILVRLIISSILEYNEMLIYFSASAWPGRGEKELYQNIMIQLAKTSVTGLPIKKKDPEGPSNSFQLFQSSDRRYTKTPVRVIKANVQARISRPVMMSPA